MRMAVVISALLALGACTHLDKQTGERVGLFGRLSDPACVNPIAAPQGQKCQKIDGRLVKTAQN